MPAAGKRTGAARDGHGGDGAQQGIAERAHFEQFLEHAPDAIVGVDGNGTIRIVNRQTERIFGYGREELVGKPLGILMPERFRERHVVHRERYFDDPRVRPMGAVRELYALRKNGTEFPVEISLSTVDADGEQLGMAAIRDVTDRVRAEREKQELIAQMERAKQRDQASRLESIGQLAGGVAHDFNNLLGVVLNYADFVAQEIGEDSPAYVDVIEIRRAAERATQLTRQLLIFSRRDVVKPEPINLNDSVREMERLLRRTLGEDVELAVKLGHDLPAVVADPGQVEQVLVNLAVNARDAMPKGGTLQIETAEVEVDADFTERNPDLSPGGYVRLTVADTGVGMDEQTVRRAFEPFFTTKAKGEGTGLGLATVYGIVRGSAGAISVYSEPGEGTSFKIHLPAVAVEEVVSAGGGARHDGASLGGSESILVVEDEDAVRTLISRILIRSGYEVTAVSRARQAVDLLRDERFDLLLTDMVMPEMRGVELVAHAEALVPELPILMMSGYTTPILEEEQRLLGRLPLVEKPFSGRTLLSEVRRLLDGEEE